MPERLADRLQPHPLEQSQHALEQWLTGSSGRYLLNKERRLLQQLPYMHGYHLMELGIDSAGSLLNQFDNLHRFALASTCATGGGGAVVRPEQLPLPSDIIETAVVHHVLEFSPRPHQVLNEVARVVAPGGHLMLFVLNPFSLFGIVKWPGSLLARRQVWRHHSLRMGRLVDWLRLLNFRPVVVKRGGFGPLPQDPGAGGTENHWWRRWGYGLGLPSGLFYAIVARKHVVKPVQNRGDLWKTLKAPNLGWRHHSRPPGYRVATKANSGRKELDNS